MHSNVRLSNPDPWTVAHNSVMFDATLSMAARLLWLAYRSHAWSGNIVFPSRKRLSDMIGCSLRTLDRANDELEERGLIERSTRWSEDGGQSTNEVILHAPEVASGSDKNNTGGSKFDAPPVSNLAHINRRTEIDIDTVGIPIHIGPTGSDIPRRQALYRGFSTARYITGGERFPLSVLDKYKPEIDFLVESGYGPEDVYNATKMAIARYSDASRVTFRSVVSHLPSLLEPTSEVATPAKSKAQKIAEAEQSGYERAIRLAIHGDQNSFMMLKSEDRDKIFSAVDDACAERLTDGLSVADASALWNVRRKSQIDKYAIAG